MRGKGPRKLFKYVPQDLDRILHRGLDHVYRLYPVWAEVAGTGLAQHSRPLGLASQCLTVQVDSPVWAAAVRQRQHSILATLNNKGDLGQVAELRIRVSPTQTAIGPTESVIRPAAPLSAGAAEAIAKTAASIEDEELKAALMRLEATTHNRRRGK